LHFPDGVNFMLYRFCFNQFHVSFFVEEVTIFNVSTQGDAEKQKQVTFNQIAKGFVSKNVTYNEA